VRRKFYAGSEKADCSLGTIGLFRAKELVEGARRGFYTGIGPPHSYPTPADLAGTFREYSIGCFFQFPAEIFGKNL
jgi:hypothetical protein